MHIKAFFSVEYLAGLKVCNQGHEDHEYCFMKETVTHSFRAKNKQLIKYESAIILCCPFLLHEDTPV